jgi:hypothetical protein
MILPVVGLYKAKGAAAMLCDRLHGNTKSAIADANIPSLMDSRRSFRRVGSMTVRKGPGSAAHALPMTRAQRACAGARVGVKQFSTADAFQFGKRAI